MQHFTPVPDTLAAADWFTSSHSNDQGGNCVEAARLWFTSSYSNNQGGDCVEGARLGGEAMAIRDTKDRSGPAFCFPAASWTGFLAAVKDGRLAG